MKSHTIILLFALLLTACTASYERVNIGAIGSAERVFAEARAKAISVAAPIMRANAPYCSLTRTIEYGVSVPFEICAQQIRLLRGEQANAHTEGEFIYLYDGAVLDLSRDEIAFLIAHEVAHDILGHTVAEGSYPQAEIEADELAVAVMHRAGFAPRAVPLFMRRFGFESSPGSVSHPAGALRLKAVETAIADLGS